MLGSFGMGLVVGLALGPACLASCGPVACAAVCGAAGCGRPAARALILFLAGRLAAYAAVGALAGWLAAGELPGAAAAISAAELVLGLALAASAFSWSRAAAAAGACPPRRATSPLLLGALVGLRPCPQFLLALAAAARSGGVGGGLACFLGLFAGSSLYFAPLAALRPRSERGRSRLLGLGATAALLAGLLFAVSGLRGLAPRPAPPAAELSEADARRVLPAGARLARRDARTVEAWSGAGGGGRERLAGLAVLGAAAGYAGPDAPVRAVVGVGAGAGAGAPPAVERVELLPSAETPLYLGRLADARFLERFRGKRLDAPFRLGRDVDAVSGATVTAEAVCAAVRGAVRPLGEHVPAPAGARAMPAPPRPGALLAAAALALTALLAPRLTGRRRLAWLAGSAALLGLGLQRFFAVGDLARLGAGLVAPGPELTGLLLFLAALLAATLWRGRVWCTHLCPFGAASELLGRSARAGARAAAPRLPPRLARALPWLMLAAIAGAAAWTGSAAAGQAEPFAATFAVLSGRVPPAAAFARAGAATALAALLLALSLVSMRFYCRRLCGAGALLGFVARAAGRSAAVPGEEEGPGRG